MTDEYDACSNSEILHVFQHVPMSNKLNLILVIFFFMYCNCFMFKQNQQVSIYGAVIFNSSKKIIKLFVVACWSSTILEILMLKYTL